jgi:DNA processing protein
VSFGDAARSARLARQRLTSQPTRDRSARGTEEVSMIDLATASAIAYLPLPLQTYVLISLRDYARRVAADSAVPSTTATALPPRPPAASLPAIGPLLAQVLRDARAAAAMWDAARQQAAGACARAETAGLRALPWGAPDYPPLLAHIADPPPLLWLRGETHALAAPCVALVGSRAASPYGLHVAERLATELARAGVTVVSGLARGIDSAAHRGALAAGGSAGLGSGSTGLGGGSADLGSGRTVAILGSGADVIYPPEHVALADRIVRGGGAILSEQPPGTPPRRGHFPRRNRLISGMSLAVVVIEASTRSGSLQTARFGLEQGREVLAVPGSIVGDRFRGSHALLRDGARLVESAADILDELRLPEAESDRPALGDPETGEAARLLAAMIPGEVYDTQELIATTGLPADAVLRQVLRLEVEGHLLRTAGPRYVRPRRMAVDWPGA